MKIYVFKEVILVGAFITVYLSILLYGLAWMGHEDNQEQIHRIPQFEEELARLKDGQDRTSYEIKNIMPSCFKGQSTKKAK